MTDRMPFDHVIIEGKATVNVQPTHASITVVLKDILPEVAASKQSVDEKSRRTIELSKSLGVSTDDITSTLISIVPEYEWRHGEEARRKGTSVSRVVTIVLRDLTRYSDLLNGLVEVPISELRKVEMDVSGRDDWEREALKQAIKNAQRTAEAAATELGMILGHVHSVSTHRTYYVGGVAQRDLNDSGAFEVGTIEIEKEVFCTFHLLPPER